MGRSGRAQDRPSGRGAPPSLLSDGNEPGRPLRAVAHRGGRPGRRHHQGDGPLALAAAPGYARDARSAPPPDADAPGVRGLVSARRPPAAQGHHPRRIGCPWATEGGAQALTSRDDPSPGPAGAGPAVGAWQVERADDPTGPRSSAPLPPGLPKSGPTRPAERVSWASAPHRASLPPLGPPCGCPRAEQRGSDVQILEDARPVVRRPTAIIRAGSGATGLVADTARPGLPRLGVLQGVP